MASQATNVGVIAGVLGAIVVAVAVTQGIVLSVESMPLGVATGIVAGLAIGGIAVLLAGGSDLAGGTRRTAVSIALFGVIALVLYLVISSVGVANQTALLAGVAVGALIALGSYLYMRDKDAQNVQAVTM